MEKFEVGSRVRFSSKDGSVSSTGMISSVNNEGSTTTFDIFVDHLHQNNIEEDEEELGVSVSRVRSLEGFELEDINTFSMAELKTNGNTLFGLKDFVGASRFYQFAIQKFSSLYCISLGSNVVVIRHPNLPKGATCVAGIVSDVDSNSSGENVFEVLLSDQSELVGVRTSQIIALPQDRENLILLRSIFLNLARCEIKRNNKGWTVYYASVSVAISEVMRSDITDKGSAETDDMDRSAEITEINQLLADALYFRAKVLLSAARPGLATKDFRLLQSIDQSKRVSQLKSEIDLFRVKRAKDNQRLAKDIARWVDDVMTGKAKSTTSASSNDQDMDLDEDLIDDDEGSSAANAKSFDPCISSSSFQSNTGEKIREIIPEIPSTANRTIRNSFFVYICMPILLLSLYWLFFLSR